MYYFAGLTAPVQRPVEPGDQHSECRNAAHEGWHLSSSRPAPRWYGTRVRSRADLRHAHHCLSEARREQYPFTAIIGAGAEIDPQSPLVRTRSLARTSKLAAGTTVGPHCVIEGHTTIGRDNRIFQFNSLGAIPQDKKYAGEPSANSSSATATPSASSVPSTSAHRATLV